MIQTSQRGFSGSWSQIVCCENRCKMCFLSRWQEEVHNILLPFVDSVWPFQHPFPVVPASSAGQERAVSHVLPLTHPLSHPHRLWSSSFSALSMTCPVEGVAVRVRGILTTAETIATVSYAGEAAMPLMLCYQSHFQISVVHLAVMLLHLQKS